MSQGSAAASGDGSGDLGRLRDEIRQTRAELGETVQALAAKVDVKARVKQSAAQRAGAVRASVWDVGVKARRHGVPWAAVAAGAVALVAVLLTIRRRHR